MTNGIWFRVAGGVSFLLMAFEQIGWVHIPGVILAVVFAIAGIALLAGK